MQAMFHDLFAGTSQSSSFKLASAHCLNPPINPNNKNAGKDWLYGLLKALPILRLMAVYTGNLFFC